MASTSTAAASSWLAPAVAALRKADALLIHAGAGMGCDSGLPDFRGPQGFWRAYPPMKKLGLSFQDCSNPRSFMEDPAFGWGFFGHRYQLYSTAVPHEGYHILRRWAQASRLGSFVFTSNVDGHFLKAGFSDAHVVECHGTIHMLQPFDPRLGNHLWPASDALASLVVDTDTFRAKQPLPMCPPEAGPAAGTLARPNILMFGDWGWVEQRTNEQHHRHETFLDSLPRDAHVVVVEIGAGSAIPTVRDTSETVLETFSNATLLRINPVESQGPGGTISISETGLAALKMLDEALAAAQ